MRTTGSSPGRMSATQPVRGLCATATERADQMWHHHCTERHRRRRRFKLRGSHPFKADAKAETLRAQHTDLHGAPASPRQRHVTSSGALYSKLAGGGCAERVAASFSKPKPKPPVAKSGTAVILLLFLHRKLSAWLRVENRPCPVLSGGERRTLCGVEPSGAQSFSCQLRVKRVSAQKASQSSANTSSHAVVPFQELTHFCASCRPAAEQDVRGGEEGRNSLAVDAEPHQPLRCSFVRYALVS